MLCSRVPVSRLLRVRSAAAAVFSANYGSVASAAAVAKPVSTPRSIGRSFSTASASAPAMLCFQCEQTESGTGCTTVGVCGKTPETAVLQDALVYALRGLSAWMEVARKDVGFVDPKISAFAFEALFSTLTNVNFDSARIWKYLQEAIAHREKVKVAYAAACKAKGVAPRTPAGSAAQWTPASREAAEKEAHERFGVLAKQAQFGKDVAGVQEMIVYGLKGMCAYAAHAKQLGKEDPAVYAMVHETLAWLEGPESADLGACLGKALAVGSTNVRVLEILDSGHNEKFGAPVPTSVSISHVPGKAILVSGHDMADLEALLQQTEGKGINVYTHGEMLPAHSYPGLKKFKHLVGNYGSAWQNQKFEFAAFPGPILMTTNCLVEPRKSYKDRIFTAGAVGFPGVPHIDTHNGRDFSKVIAKALEQPGFKDVEKPEKSITVGFGHKTVLSVADKVIAAVDAGKVKGLHLIGGCDGSESERSFYTKLAAGLPEDNVILTLGCAKYRFNKLDLGTVEGLPRVLDMGQCNDSYSAVVVASALAKHYKVGINDLPLKITLSWFEQKAVAVLLSLLSLNVKNITIGPNLPAFVTPAVLNVLVEKFNIAPIPTNA